jgi:hypothetical protein
MIAYAPRDADLGASDQSPSSRAVTFTLSPKMSPSLAMTSPTLAPIRQKAHLSPFGLAFIRPLKRLLDLDRTVNRIGAL